MQKRLYGLLGALIFGIGSVGACSGGVQGGGSGTNGQGGGHTGSSSAANGTGAGGSGGEGGVETTSSSISTSSSSSTSGGGSAVCVSATDFDKCHESSGGQCACDGTCNGTPVHVACSWVDTKQFCSCYENGALVGQCEGADPCLVEATCCADFF